MVRSRAPVKSAGAFRTIGEVAIELDVPQHVLRFWESKFPEIKPLKRGGGRRYYRPEDVDLLRRVQSLLHTEGYTIKGVQRLLSDGEAATAVGPPPSQREFPLSLPPASRPPPADPLPASESVAIGEPLVAEEPTEVPEPPTIESPPAALPEETRREIVAVLVELRAILRRVEAES